MEERRRFARDISPRVNDYRNLVLSLLVHYFKKKEINNRVTEDSRININIAILFRSLSFEYLHAFDLL